MLLVYARVHTHIHRNGTVHENNFCLPFHIVEILKPNKTILVLPGPWVFQQPHMKAAWEMLQIGLYDPDIP